MEILMNRHNLSISNSENPSGGCRSAAEMPGRAAVSGMHTIPKMAGFVFCMKLLCVAAVLVIFMGVVVLPQYSYAYTASLCDKMDRLMSVEGSKIVLIGDSNLSFGINSGMLEEAFHMPVVNMGLHGSMGNAFHEEMAKVNLCEGDIIVVAHTGYADQDKITDPVTAWLAVENHPQLWRLVRPKDIPDMYFAFPVYAKKALTLWASKEGNEQNTGTVYSRFAFNKYGDVSFERQTGGYTFTEKSVRVPKVNGVCAERLNELNRYVTDRGASLVIAAYPVACGEFTPPEEEYVQFQEKLQEAVECPVISDYRDYFLGYEYFYDTEYHLTREGADLRTRQLICDLEEWMAESDF